MFAGLRSIQSPSGAACTKSNPCTNSDRCFIQVRICARLLGARFAADGDREIDEVVVCLAQAAIQARLRWIVQPIVSRYIVAALSSSSTQGLG